MYKIYMCGKLLATFNDYFDAINFFNKKVVHLNEDSKYCITCGDFELQFELL